MIPAENEREKAFGERLFYGFGNVLAGFRNFLKVLGALFAYGHFLRLLHFQVADVFHGVAEFLDGSLQTCAAQRRGAHVHATTALAEVHGDADDANFLRHMPLVFRDPSRMMRSRESAPERSAQKTREARNIPFSGADACWMRHGGANYPH